MPNRVLNLGVIGAGRIGRLHAENIATGLTSAKLAGIVDLNLDQARALAERLNVGLVGNDYQRLLENEAIDAVVVCSATATHVPIIKAAAARGKHIFCEKPLGLEIAGVREALAAAQQAGVKLQVGFNRRFDASFAKARESVAAGRVGVPHLLRITSRDPAPPPLEYIRVSGGIFLDMTIHDFDMSRFLTGTEAVEVYAVGAALINPLIAEAGDIDTAVVTMKMSNGMFATIDNSRQAVYGYDQRVEIFGSAGMVSVPNWPADNHVLWNNQGAHSAPPPYFFLERYKQSYVTELQAFVDCVLRDEAPPVSGPDGLAPLLMGLAALRSLREKRPVLMAEIGG